MSEINDRQCILFLSCGQIACISESDFESVNQHSWRTGTNGYVYMVGGRVRGKCCLLHRFITKPTNSQEVHHFDGNKLNNARNNLIVVSASDHQKKYHLEPLIARNRAGRIYPETISCAGCGVVFTVDRDHRGRNKFCTKLCANKNRRSAAARSKPKV